MCDRCEFLEEENRQLRDELFGSEDDIPREIKMTPACRRILACLLRRDRICSEDVLFAASRGRGAKAEILYHNLMATQVFKLRRAIEPYGLKIGNEWATGYFLTPETRQRLLNWKSQQDIAA